MCSALLRLHLEHAVISFGPLTTHSYKEWVSKQGVFSLKEWGLRRDLISLKNHMKRVFSDVRANYFYHAYNEMTRGNSFNLRGKVQIR